MTALYRLDMRTLEYNIFADGIGMRFDFTGKYKGALGNIGMGATPVDVVSILQQGNLCEVAVLANGEYYKQRVDLDRAVGWTKTSPVRHKAVLSLRRKVKDIVCLQMIYVYNNNSIKPYLSSLL